MCSQVFVMIWQQSLMSRVLPCGVKYLQRDRLLHHNLHNYTNLLKCLDSESVFNCLMFSSLVSLLFTEYFDFTLIFKHSVYKHSLAFVLTWNSGITTIFSSRLTLLNKFWMYTETRASDKVCPLPWCLLLEHWTPGITLAGLHCTSGTAGLGI